MKRLVDANAWLALSIDSHPHYHAAQDWYQGESFAPGELVICTATQMAVLRHLTQAAFMRACHAAAFTNAQAIDFLAALCADPAVSRAAEPERTRELWLDLARRPQASPLVWMDAYLAAFAICIGAEIVTFDRGFLHYKPAGLAVTLLQAG